MPRRWPRSPLLPASPRSSRKRTGHDLHLRQHVAEVLGMLAGAAAALHELHLGHGERRAREHIVDVRAPRSFERRRVDANSGGCRGTIDIVGQKQFSGVSPDIVHGPLYTIVTLLRTISELDHTLSAMSDMISHFLDRFGGNAGELLVPRPL